MCTKLFHRLSYLLCLFQTPCFAAFKTVSSDSTNVDNLSNKNHAICTIHSGELQIEPSSFGNELLVCGFIRELEPKVTNKIIPDCIMSLCVDFSRRMLPCDCLNKKYLELDIDKDRKEALIFFLMYKVEDVQDEKGKSRKTIFHCACEDDHLGLAKLLKERGANINAKNSDGNNALHYACGFSRNQAMVTWLLDVCKIGIESKGYEQMTPFLYAAAKGQLGIAKLLKEQGANIHAKDKYRDNALNLACYFSGNQAMVTWLLDVCKIGIESKGCEQMTPFLYAALKGQLAIAKLLRQRGANIHAKDKDRENALHYACLFSGSVAMVTWLLDVCKIGIETKGYEQMTPFLCTAKKGQLAIAKLLKKRGVKIYAKGRDRDNALHYTCLFSGSVAMVTWLLDVCKIGLETKGYRERTPFLCAALKGQLAIAKLLKKRGANIYAKDAYGNNALHNACLFSGSVAMVTWLLDVCKIDIESKGQYKKTPFLCAAKGGQLGIAKLLRKQGANINAKDTWRNSALYLAKFSGNKELIRYLERQTETKTARGPNFWSRWF